MQNRLAKLTRLIGSECARQEFKWMKQSQRSASGQLKLLDMLDRRLAGEPLQYILGHIPFGPLDLLTRPPTLIPRPETEDWTLRLAQRCAPSPDRRVHVLDLCTGSGCIPLSLCHLWPPGSTRAVGVDISPDAVRLAADNYSRSRSSTRPCHPSITAVASNLRIPSESGSSQLHGDPEQCRNRDNRPPPLNVETDCENVFIPLLGDVHDPSLLRRLDPQPPFDVITANPPYIPLSIYHTLPSSVKNYEDPRALIGDPPGAPLQDGLSFYRTIAALLAQKGVLAQQAVVALEVGHDQAHAVHHIFRHTPGLHFEQIEIWKDPWDKDRVVFARAA